LVGRPCRPIAFARSNPANLLNRQDFPILARLVLNASHRAAPAARQARSDSMQETRTNLILRDDTFLGVCAGLGEDLGFDPNWLRVPLAVCLLWNPAAVIGIYLAAGLVVLLSRLVAPNPRPAAEPAEVALSAPGEPEVEVDRLPMAA
jgi:phage shock protein C